MGRNRLTFEEGIDLYKEIFEGTYTVHIKQIHSFRQEYIKTYGIPMTGDDEWDSAIANSFSRTPLTIAELADHHENGIKFYFVYSESIPKIYEHIKHYIDMIGRMFSMNYLSARHLSNDEDIAKVLHDIYSLAEFANFLRPSISWINEEMETEEIKEFNHSISLLSRIQYDRNSAENSQVEISSMPEEIVVDNYMSSSIAGNTRNWDIRPKGRVNRFQQRK